MFDFVQSSQDEHAEIKEFDMYFSGDQKKSSFQSKNDTTQQGTLQCMLEGLPSNSYSKLTYTCSCRQLEGSQRGERGNTEIWTKPAA